MEKNQKLKFQVTALNVKKLPNGDNETTSSKLHSPHIDENGTQS